MVNVLDIYIPDKINAILEKIEKSGFEAYLVGGCVRDSILGKTPADYDIATSAEPEKIMELFGDGEFKAVGTGIKHGTVSVFFGKDCVEITTFRTDMNYFDHRHPGSVSFTDNLIDDLSRRDFTINAMAYSQKVGLIDKFGGQRDLFRHKIVCVGEPAVRFNEDALRIMRAMRFASVLDFSIDKITAMAIHDLKRLLANISAERISKELDLLITGSAPADVLVQFSDVISVIIPEMRPSIGFDQHSRYHAYDVWTHTAVAVQHSIPDRDVRLALLLHDIAKPMCCCLDEEGGGHFRNHEKAGAELAEEILKRLHYPNDVVNRVSTLIKYHFVTPIDDSKVVKKLLSILGKEDFFKLTEVMKGDSRAKKGFCYERVDVLSDMQKKARTIIDSGECFTLSQLDVDGKDITALGYSGKDVGNVLDALLAEVIDEKTINTHDELIAEAQKILRTN